MSGDLVKEILENPFLILGASAGASRIELEREAQKLLGMLELGLASAASYATPLGPRPRTPELVRAAIATLRDPARRLAAEIWTRAPGAVHDTAPVDGTVSVHDTAGFQDGLAKLGWRGK